MERCKCYFCDKEGHIVWDCRAKKALNNGRGRPRGARGNRSRGNRGGRGRGGAPHYVSAMGADEEGEESYKTESYKTEAGADFSEAYGKEEQLNC